MRFVHPNTYLVREGGRRDARGRIGRLTAPETIGASRAGISRHSHTNDLADKWLEGL